MDLLEVWFGAFDGFSVFWILCDLGLFLVLMLGVCGKLGVFGFLGLCGFYLLVCLCACTGLFG